MRRPARSLTAALAALALPVAPAAGAPSVPPDGAVVANGPVRAVAEGRGRVYFGGDFTRVGSFLGSNMRLDWATGELRPGFARTNGQVSDVIADGRGGWYLAGEFNWVEGKRRTNVVHVRPDGKIHEAFNARVEGFVGALALDGARLYLGGSLRRVDGRERRGIAVVDAATGRLDTGFRYGGRLPVTELALSGPQSGGARRLYAHGFESFDGPGPVQALDPFTGSVLDEFRFPFEARKVGALAVRGDTLYVGGGAGHYKGSEFGAAGALVALDGRTGELLRSFAPGGGLIEGSVESIEVDGDRLVVGGDFDRVGQAPGAGVAVLDARSGDADPGFEAAVSGRVAEVAVAGGLVHAAAGSQIVALDSTGGRAALSAPRVDGPVDALAAQGGILYAGGRFGLADALARRGLAAIDARSGRLLRGFRPRAGPGKHAQLELAHGRLFVGDPRGVRGPLQAVSASSGRPLRGFRAPRTADVYDFAIGRDVIYGAVGGRARVIAFDANSGRRLRSFRVRTGGYVTDLEYAAGRVYLAGGWSAPGGDRSVIAVRRRSGVLIRRFDARARGEVQALASDGGRLFMAGPFGRIAGARRAGAGAVWLGGGGLDGGFRPRGVPRRGAELDARGGLLYARDTARDRLRVYRTRDGRRLAGPRWPKITAVEPAAGGAWLGAGVGSGRAATWFLAFRRAR